MWTNASVLPAVSLERELTQTSAAPSGDQTGGPNVEASHPGTRRAGPPVEDTVKYPPPSRSEKKAMRVPSGDQLGFLSAPGWSSVRFVDVPPSVRFTQMSKLPLSSEW